MRSNGHEFVQRFVLNISRNMLLKIQEFQIFYDHTNESNFQYIVTDRGKRRNRKKQERNRSKFSFVGLETQFGIDRPVEGSI